MGSSNIQVFDPTLQNAESDATYATDTARINGATTGLCPSPLFNKLAAQVSMVCAALGQALANKGFVISDASYTNLIAALSNIQTTADLLAKLQIVPYATSITFDAGAAVAFDLTLTGNVSASAVVNAAQGQVITFIIAQDSVGGRTFAWPSNVANPPAISTVLSSVTIQSFIVRPNGQLVPVAPLPGLARGDIAGEVLTLPTSEGQLQVSEVSTVAIPLGGVTVTKGIRVFAADGGYLGLWPLI